MKSSGQVREEILDAAARLFARYGFKKTSVDDVAAAARIGKGSVYLHFGSKDEIFAEVVRRASDRTLDALNAAVEGSRSPASKVAAFVETKQKALARLADEVHLGEDTILEVLPAAAAYRRAHENQEQALLAAVLREGNATGAFAVVDPDRLAAGIIAWLTAIETSSVVKRKDESIRAGIEDVLSVLVRGLGRFPANTCAVENGEAVVRETTPSDGSES